MINIKSLLSGNAQEWGNIKQRDSESAKPARKVQKLGNEACACVMYSLHKKERGVVLKSDWINIT